MPEPMSDEDIRKLAQVRVGFRYHLFAYLVLNAFFAAIWWFTGRDGHYWPIWVHLGWGIGVAFNGWSAYGGGATAVRDEEEKLRRRYGRGP